MASSRSCGTRGTIIPQAARLGDHESCQQENDTSNSSCTGTVPATIAEMANLQSGTDQALRLTRGTSMEKDLQVFLTTTVVF